MNLTIFYRQINKLSFSALIFLFFSLVACSENSKASQSVQPQVLTHGEYFQNNAFEFNNTPLLFTPERIAKIKSRIAINSDAWDYLQYKISLYYERVPYGAGKFATAFVLAYFITQEERQLTRAAELFQEAYFNDPDVGWRYYNNRNSFRNGGRWAIMGYSWIKNTLPVARQKELENYLALWAEYWLNYINYEENLEGMRIGDSDEITSLAENLTLLGYVLIDSDTHKDLGYKSLHAGDRVLNEIVVEHYMNNVMKGGAWAEGSDYSSGTQPHWIMTFLINKDKRNIDYPTNYAQLTLTSLMHQTLANYTGVYKYGDEERASDYESMSGDYRYELALYLMGILEDEAELTRLNTWFNILLSNDGFKGGSTNTGFLRLLFHDPSAIPAQEQPEEQKNITRQTSLKNNIEVDEAPELDTFHFSEGIGLIASRDSWDSNATNLYFINRNIDVHHEHKDALSFDIAHKGNWVTKEATGYGGNSMLSIAHNTILIENAEGGSSSPTGRAAGSPKFHYIKNDSSVTLISADATQLYNMSGYYATNYAELVNRQLAFIKPNIVITYDHVITDPSQIKDLRNYTELPLSIGMSHTRWVKTVQHFQEQPQPHSTIPKTFTINDGKNKVLYSNVWPLNTKIEVVDEQELWASSNEYTLPLNQRKWGIFTSEAEPTPNNELLNIIQFSGAEDDISFDHHPVVMTQENGYINDDNVIGVAISSNNKQYIILFNQQPDTPLNNVEFTKPEGYSTAEVYIIGAEEENQ